jgi:hypothetical protein
MSSPAVGGMNETPRAMTSAGAGNRRPRIDRIGQPAGLPEPHSPAGACPRLGDRINVRERIKV